MAKHTSQNIRAHVKKGLEALSSYRFDTEEERLARYERVSFGITLGSCEGSSVFQLNEDRFRHTAIIGRTGSGKSNLLLQMEREDIRSGAGVAIIAAHEEDALYPLRCVPEDRMDDVVIIDPTNTHLLPCLNPLDVDIRDRAAVSKAVSDCTELLKSQCQHDWAGPRFDAMARLGLETMLDPGFPDEPHLGLLEKLFSDPDYVRSFLCDLKDTHLIDRWNLEGNSRRSSDADERVSWFLSKVVPFSSDRVLRTIFGPGKRTIDLRRIVEEGKILVAYIPVARIGVEAATLLRTRLIHELKDAILSRGETGDGTYWGICGGSETKSDLDPFFVYIDEFAEHATLDFEALLAEARKYRVGIVLAFQNLAQMRTLDIKTGTPSTQLLEAIMGNVGTIVCFPVGSNDANVLARQLDVGLGDILDIERYRPLAQVFMDNQPMLCTLDVPRMPEGDNRKMPKWLAEEQIIHNRWLPVRR